MTAPDSTAATSATVSVASKRMSPRKRAKISQAIQYSILGIAVVIFALVADWERIKTNLFNVSVAKDLLPQLPAAGLNTIKYTVAAFALGLTVGVILALMRLSSVALYRWIATIYVEFFRGIPALLVVFTVGFAIPVAFGVAIDSITLKAALALGVVSSAYIAETLRAGIQAVPKGQIEAARSLGMSSTRTTITVILPQAFRIVLPPMTNEIILLTKDTSLIYLLGLSAANYDLTKIGRDALNSGAGGLTGLFVIGAAYLCITIPLGFLARWLEKRTSQGARR